MRTPSQLLPVTNRPIASHLPEPTAAGWGPPYPPFPSALLAGAWHFASRCAWAEIRTLPTRALGSALLSPVVAGRDRLAKLFPQKSRARSWGLRAWHQHVLGTGQSLPFPGGGLLCPPSPGMLPDRSCSLCSSLMPVPLRLPPCRPAKLSSALPPRNQGRIWPLAQPAPLC